MVSKIFIVAVCLVLVTYEVNAARGGKKKKQKATIDTDDNQLAKDVQDLKETLDGLLSGGTCSTGNVHVYFHAGSEGHDHHVSEDDQHVHVHVHTGEEHHDHGDGDSHDHKAVCDMHDPYVNVDGKVRFVQGSNEHHARVEFDFAKLGKQDDGFVNYTAHVHFSADLTEGCTYDGFGPHYDPYDPNVDVGDLGVIGTKGGKVVSQHPETFLTLYGKYSILGRGIIIHDKNHKPLSCCVIGWSKDEHQDQHFHSHHVDHTSHSHDHSGHAHSHPHDHAH